MAKGLKPATLTQQEFTPRDHTIAARMASALGYVQTVYTSTSALWGLFCINENPATARPSEPIVAACIIKTTELGFLVVILPEDLGLDHKGHGRVQRRANGSDGVL